MGAVSLALTHPGFIQSCRGKAGMLGQSPENRSKAVGLTLWILDRIATEPACKEDHRNLAGSILRPRNKHPQLVSGIVLGPSVDHFGVLEAFARRRCRSLGYPGERQKNDDGN